VRICITCQSFNHHGGRKRVQVMEIVRKLSMAIIFKDIILEIGTFVINASYDCKFFNTYIFLYVYDFKSQNLLYQEEMEESDN